MPRVHARIGGCNELTRMETYLPNMFSFRRLLAGLLGGALAVTAAATAGAASIGDEDQLSVAIAGVHRGLAASDAQRRNVATGELDPHLARALTSIEEIITARLGDDPRATPDQVVEALESIVPTTTGSNGLLGSLFDDIAEAAGVDLGDLDDGTVSGDDESEGETTDEKDTTADTTADKIKNGNENAGGNGNGNGNANGAVNGNAGGNGNGNAGGNETSNGNENAGGNGNGNGNANGAVNGNAGGNGNGNAGGSGNGNGNGNGNGSDG